MGSEEISNTDDTIGLRDVIVRVEELRGEREAHDALAEQGLNAYIEDNDELQRLEAFLSECQDIGGDEKWEGHWYPATAVHDDYFERYAEELALALGMIDGRATWPNNCIDWNEGRLMMNRQQQVDIINAHMAGKRILLQHRNPERLPPGVSRRDWEKLAHGEVAFNFVEFDYMIEPRKVEVFLSMPIDTMRSLANGEQMDVTNVAIASKPNSHALQAGRCVVQATFIEI